MELPEVERLREEARKRYRETKSERELAGFWYLSGLWWGMRSRYPLTLSLPSVPEHARVWQMGWEDGSETGEGRTSG